MSSATVAASTSWARRPAAQATTPTRYAFQACARTLTAHATPRSSRQARRRPSRPRLSGWPRR
eukprot:1344968-Alexandrium_andersonii.AAC.1